jgi:CelD/BcsL family acetyltransferase involved in cellulose biosynthesis
MTRLERVSSLAAVEGEWAELARRSGNLFATPEWLGAWWRHFGAGRRQILYVLREDDGTLSAAVALYHAAARPLRTLRFVGHGAGDWLGPIHAPDRPDLGAAVLRGALAEEKGRWDVLLAEQVPPGDGLARAVGGVELFAEGCPDLVIDGREWDELLAARSANFRGQVRRRGRRLEREHQVAFRLADDPARLDDDLAALFRLHAERWAPEGKDALAPRAGFHREFAATAFQRGWLRLWLLEVDGTPVAAWYGFRYAGEEWYYQAGRDPAWERHAVGFVLLAHTVRAAADDGMRTYRLLRGGEPFKYRWADRDPGLHTFVAGGALRGRLAVGLLRAVQRLPSAVSRWALRLAGRAAGVRG